MATNAGVKTMRLEGDLTGFGVARYDAEQLANILGFSHMADKHQIHNDNTVEDAFIATTLSGTIKFARDGRLYTYNPSTEYLASVASTKDTEEHTAITGTDDTDTLNDISKQKESYFFVDFVMTVEGTNRDGYTDKQYKQAKLCLETVCEYHR